MRALSLRAADSSPIRFWFGEDLTPDKNHARPAAVQNGAGNRGLWRRRLLTKLAGWCICAMARRAGMCALERSDLDALGRTTPLIA